MRRTIGTIVNGVVGALIALAIDQSSEPSPYLRVFVAGLVLALAYLVLTSRSAVARFPALSRIPGAAAERADGSEGSCSTAKSRSTGDYSPVVSASHSGYGNIVQTVDQSAHHHATAEMPNTYKGERLITLSAQQLYGYYKAHTALQADKLVAPFLSKPFKISGTLNNISLFDDKSILVSIDLDELHCIFLEFDLAWTDRLAELNRGDQIEVIGRIHSIRSNTIWLKDCVINE